MCVCMWVPYNDVLLLQLCLQARTVFQASWNTRTETQAIYREFGSFPKVWSKFCFTYSHKATLTEHEQTASWAM